MSVATIAPSVATERHVRRDKYPYSGIEIQEVSSPLIASDAVIVFVPAHNSDPQLSRLNLVGVFFCERFSRSSDMRKDPATGYSGSYRAALCGEATSYRGVFENGFRPQVHSRRPISNSNGLFGAKLTRRSSAAIGQKDFRPERFANFWFDDFGQRAIWSTQSNFSALSKCECAFSGFGLRINRAPLPPSETCTGSRRGTASNQR